MGFGRGKGFTSKKKTETIKHTAKGGGGKRTATLADKNPSYTAVVT